MVSDLSIQNLGESGCSIGDSNSEDQQHHFQLFVTISEKLKKLILNIRCEISTATENAGNQNTSFWTSWGIKRHTHAQPLTPQGGWTRN